MLLVLGAGAPAQEVANNEKVGIDEKLGETIPLEKLFFVDENGTPVVLKDLFTRPTVLTLVYLRCPSICSPLIRGIRRRSRPSRPLSA